MIDVSVVTVGHNTRDFVRACLASLRSHRAIEVLLVDSGSTDGTAAMVASEFPDVRLLPSRSNLGFTRGNNRAARLARGRYLLFLNPDTVVAPGAIERMAEYLDAHPGVAVVGPRLEYPDGSVQSSRRRFPGILTGLVESTVLQRWLGRVSPIRRYYLEDVPDTVRQDVDWLVGACLMVRREALAAAGLFDERFFMYSEEVDLCRRIRERGWRVAYLPEALVVHHEGRSSEQNPPARDIRFHESRARYYAKHHGSALAVAVRLAVLMHFLFLVGEESVKLALKSKPELRRTRLAGYREVLAAHVRALVRPSGVCA